MIIYVIAFGVVIGVFLLGGYFFKLKALKERGVKTMATVIKYEESEGDDGILHHPVLRFKDRKGAVHTKRMKLGASWKLYDRGTELEILYNPENPDEWMLCKPPQPLVYILIALALMVLAGIILSE